MTADLGRTNQLSAGVLLSLALLSTTGPFTIDLYLPAFPQMMADLGTTATGVQLTLTSCLLGIAVGQLVFGSLSDRFGRRAPLISGSALCVAASAVAATAPTIELLIAARAVQGFAGAAGVVIGRAVIADLSTGRRTASNLSLITAIGGAAPVVAPMAGGFLAPTVSWRGMLWILVGVAVAMLLVSVLVVPESMRRGSSDTRLAGAARALADPRYLGYTAIFVLSFASLMAYISAAPFVYQVVMGVSVTTFGLLFGINALLSIIAGLVSSRLVLRVGANRILAVGLIVIFASGSGVLLLGLLGQAVWSLVPLATLSVGIGLAFGNATALALERVRLFSGTGSAVLGAAQFGMGAIVSPLANLSGTNSTIALGFVMAVASSTACVAFAALSLSARSIAQRGSPLHSPRSTCPTE